MSVYDSSLFIWKIKIFMYMWNSFELFPKIFSEKLRTWESNFVESKSIMTGSLVMLLSASLFRVVSFYIRYGIYDFVCTYILLFRAVFIFERKAIYIIHVTQAKLSWQSYLFRTNKIINGLDRFVKLYC